MIEQPPGQRQEMRFASPRGFVSVRLTNAKPTVVLAELLPHSETDPAYTGSNEAVSDDPTFPIEAFAAGDKAAVQAWLGAKHPDWFAAA